jgi:hypothetical protein
MSRSIPRIHKLKSCDRLSYLSELYNVPPVALLWASPGLMPLADDIFYQTPAEDLNLYIPNSVSVSWGERYLSNVTALLTDVQELRVDPQFLATVLPVVMPLDIFTADAVVRLLMYGPKSDDVELKTQRIYYLMGSLWSALQNETILAAIESLRNFNQSFDAQMSVLELQRGPLCINLTHNNFVQPHVDCMCNSSRPYLACLVDLLMPLTVEACKQNNVASTCPLYMVNGTVYGSSDLNSMGRFQVSGVQLGGRDRCEGSVGVGNPPPLFLWGGPRGGQI